MTILKDTERKLNEAQKKQDEQTLTELAKLSPIEFDRVKKEKADVMGINVSTLESEVKKIRPKDVDDRKQGRSITIHEVIPWESPVDPAELLDEISERISRHMVIRPEYADACTLWVVHDHVFELFDHTPRLVINGPEPECGKTLLMTHIVGNMVNRRKTTELMKAAPFFRMVEIYRPTFLIDEVDVFIREDSDLLAAINNGFEPHGCVQKCVGEDFEPRDFSTYCPVAMSGIRLQTKLPRTTLSRSVVINLDRSTHAEQREKEIYNSRKHKEVFKVLGRKIARVVRDYRQQLAKVDESIIPEWAINRLADKWFSLLRVASLGGDRWVNRAYKAMRAENSNDEPSATIELLTDIQTIMGDRTAIWTTDLIDKLCDLEDSRWTSYNFKARDSENRRITSRQLSKLLEPYNVKPMDVRIGGVVRKGYKLDKLEPAFQRYLRDTPHFAATPLQRNNGAGPGDNLSATQNSVVADKNTMKANNNAGCSAVAFGEEGKADINEDGPVQDRIEVAI